MERSIFFNSAPGDPRTYQASDFADYFGDVLSSGLLHTDNIPAMQVQCEGTDLRTYVKPGKAIIRGYAYENTTDLYLKHALPEASLDRIDRIILRLDKRNQSRFIKLFVLQGTASASPVPPTLTKDEFIYELSLAQIRIRANTSTLVPGDLIDERLDENLCGLVYSLISIPISQFQGQWDNWFSSNTSTYEQEWNDWFSGIQHSGFASAEEFAAHKADDVSHNRYGADTGAANAKVVTLSPVPTSLLPGFSLRFKNNVANTGATTLNINSLGAKPVLRQNGNAAVSGTLKAGLIYTVVYDGTSFILQGEGGSGNALPTDVVAGKTFTNDNGEQVGVGDPDLIPTNIKKGVNIFGVVGDSLQYASGEQLMGAGYWNSSQLNPVGVKLAKLSTTPSATESTVHLLSNDYASNENALYLGVTRSGVSYFKKISPDTKSLSDIVIWEITLPHVNMGKIFQKSNGDFYVWCYSGTMGALLRIKQDGTIVWTKTSDKIGNSSGSGRSVSVDNQDNIYVTTYASSGESITKYDPNFNKVWGNSEKTFVSVIEVMDNGDIYVWHRNGQTQATTDGSQWVGVVHSSGTYYLWNSQHTAYWDGYTYWARLTAYYVNKTSSIIYQGYYTAATGQATFIQRLAPTTGGVTHTISTTSAGYQSGNVPDVDDLKAGPNGTLVWSYNYMSGVVSSTLGNLISQQTFGDVVMTYGSKVAWLYSEYVYLVYSGARYKSSNRDVYKLP